MMYSCERQAWLALAATSRLKPIDIASYCQKLGGPLETARRLARPNLEFAEPVLTPADSDYPDCLLHLADPPAWLFFKGRPLPPLGVARVAVIGSRRATNYGLSFARKIGFELAEAGVSVVSGLAAGIDSAAHHGALKASAGHPIGVLGCGIDCVYPRHNHRLYQRVTERGTLVSEYPLDTRPAKFRFPARNRLIAALSQALVVVEAGRGSGALGTVDHALELGRPVFAVPGAVGSPNREGVHGLLRDGAQVATSAEEVLHEVLGKVDRVLTLPELEEPLAGVFRAVDPRGSSLDELVLRTGLEPDLLASLLVELELDGRLRRERGGWFTPV